MGLVENAEEGDSISELCWKFKKQRGKTISDYVIMKERKYRINRK